MSSKFVTILIALEHGIVQRIDPTHLHIRVFALVLSLALPDVHLLHIYLFACKLILKKHGLKKRSILGLCCGTR
ncbi:hypothetical protein RGQ29_002390 [Quercus rubra]|uniref:Uncharacterized protein n=1 Tax=Quercus rubra TaxID=3512 RepID=A0AAN7ICT9_QUERU|nr:hypothetical protein RGQ29_002390 [Quercus rubra]